MKFLVIWELDVSRLGQEVVHSVMRMPEYAKGLRERGKLVSRFHIVGKHGGAWIYDVESNEELERMLAMAPVYNYARYEVYALAEMDTPADVLQPLAAAGAVSEPESADNG
jgi:muconolactone delta-isomerase